jgi:uncharacterized membrane protein
MMISDNAEFLPPFSCRVLAAILKMADIFKILKTQNQLSLPNNVWRLIVFAPFLIIIIIIIILSFRAPWTCPWQICGKGGQSHIFGGSKGVGVTIESYGKLVDDIGQCWIFTPHFYAVFWQPFWKWQTSWKFWKRRIAPLMVTYHYVKFYVSIIIQLKHCPISSNFDRWVNSVSGRFGRLHNH